MIKEPIDKVTILDLLENVNLKGLIKNFTELDEREIQRIQYRFSAMKSNTYGNPTGKIGSERVEKDIQLTENALKEFFEFGLKVLNRKTI